MHALIIVKSIDLEIKKICNSVESLIFNIVLLDLLWKIVHWNIHGSLRIKKNVVVDVLSLEFEEDDTLLSLSLCILRRHAMNGFPIQSKGYMGILTL